MADPKIAIFGDSKSAQKAFAQLERKVDLLTEKLKRSGRQSKKTADVGTKAFRSMGSGIASVLAPLALLTTAMGVARSEFERTLKLGQDAKQAATNLAPTLRDVLINLGGQGLDPAQAQKKLEGISTRLGVKQVDVANVVSTALSASGGNQKLAFSAAEAAIRLTPSRPAVASTLAGSLLDLSQQFGTQPKEALGFLLSLQSQARVTDVASLGQSIAPAVGGVAISGKTSARKAGALVAGISRALNDPTGLRSRTSSISLAAQLQETLPGVEPLEALEQLRRDQPAAQAFLKKASFEKAFQPIVQQLLSAKETPSQQFVAQALQGLPKIEGAQGIVDARLKDIESLPSVQLETLTRRFEQTKNQLSLNNLGRGFEESTRQGLFEALEQSGLEGPRSAFLKTKFAFSTQDPEEFAAEHLRDRAQFLRGKETKFAASRDAGNIFNPRSLQQERQPTPNELQNATALELLAEKLDQLNHIQSEQLNEIKALKGVTSQGVEGNIRAGVSRDNHKRFQRGVSGKSIGSDFGQE